MSVCQSPAVLKPSEALVTCLPAASAAPRHQSGLLLHSTAAGGYARAAREHDARAKPGD